MATGRLKCDLKLINYYDEVPVSYGSTITSMEVDSIELAVHEYQALVMKHDKSTLIKSQHFILIWKSIVMPPTSMYQRKLSSCTTLPMHRSGQNVGKRRDIYISSR